MTSWCVGPWRAMPPLVKLPSIESLVLESARLLPAIVKLSLNKARRRTCRRSWHGRAKRCPRSRRPCGTAGAASASHVAATCVGVGCPNLASRRTQPRAARPAVGGNREMAVFLSGLERHCLGYKMRLSCSGSTCVCRRLALSSAGRQHGLAVPVRRLARENDRPSADRRSRPRGHGKLRRFSLR
jgi:hypothetical protein